ncbi:MAG: ABC transporter substrate-binding protein [Planctomycetota bacterium]
MESKVGLKDILLFLLVATTLVSVGLLFVQVDRAWDRLDQAVETTQAQSTAMDQLTQEVRRSRQKNQEAIEAFREATGALLAVAASRQADPSDPAEASDTSDPGETTNPADPADAGLTSGSADVDAALAALDQASQDAPDSLGPAPVENDYYELLRAQRQEPDFATGGQFVGSFQSIVRKITPYISGDVYGTLIQSYVMQTLATRDYDDPTRWRPLLAESWTQSDDGLTFTFTLRPDARFSDGTPVRASDVVFTYEWIMNPRVEAPRARVYYEKVQSIEALDDRTVRFVFSEPYYLSFAVAAGVEVLSEKYYGQFSPERFNALPGLLFGSGPYKLPTDPAEWRPPSAGAIRLVRNDNYWGVPPALDEIVYRIITDENARLSTFINGEIDAFNPAPEQYSETLDDQGLRGRTELFIHEPITTGYRYIGWNQRKPDGSPTAFADRRVRQAMTLLIDRQRMVDELMKGRASISTGPFHRLNPQSDPDIDPWPYDPERAKALLTEAGYADRNGDGVLEHPEHGPLSFRLMIPSGIDNYLRMADMAAESMRRAGVVMQADPTEWNILTQRLDERNFDAAALGWGASVESDIKQIFHSESIDGGGDNAVAYTNPELDAVIDQARSTMESEPRYALWRRAHRLLHEDQPYTYLFTRQQVQLVNDRFRGDRVTKIGLSPRDEWYVPRAERRY